MRIRRRSGLILLLTVLLLLSGCGDRQPVPENGELIQVSLERGHGSEWGNQFYICVDPEKIQAVSRFTEGADGAYTTQYDIPITAERWQQVAAAATAAASQMEVEQPPGFLSALLERFGPPVLDGGAYHTLTLTWETENTIEEITYIWTGRPAEANLEDLLEELPESNN